MIPPTTTGASTPASRSCTQRLGHQVEVRARQDREPDDVDVLVPGGRRDLRRREPDALVDDLHAGVAGRDRDLLGAVRVAVEAGLADEDADRAAVGRGRAATRARTCCSSSPGRTDTAPTPVGARYSPNTSRSAPAHSPTVPPARASAIVAGMRFSVVAATSRQVVERLVDRALVARGAPRFERLDLLALDRGIDA